MNDRAVALLEQYEIEVLRTRKGRGAILCDTQQGCLIFKGIYRTRGTAASAGAGPEAPGGTGNRSCGAIACHKGRRVIGDRPGRCQIYSEDLVGRPRM